VKFDVRVDLREVEKLATDMQRKQIPFAAARALTLTAKSAEQAVVGEMRKVFDRPTPWTLKSTYVQPAKKNSLVAMVKIKDDKNNARVAAIDGWRIRSMAASASPRVLNTCSAGTTRCHRMLTWFRQKQ
jgi:hypothetical protein